MSSFVFFAIEFCINGENVCSTGSPISPKTFVFPPTHKSIILTSPLHKHL